MKNYIVICVFDREIICVGVAKTIEKAQKLMKDDFMEVFLDRYDENVLEKHMGEDWDIKETTAWLNACDYDFDWKILDMNTN